MNAWVVTTKRGTQAVVSNHLGWENFVMNMTLSNAVVANGVYIPIGEIDNILPLADNAPAPKNMAEVLHLVPQPPKGAT